MTTHHHDAHKPAPHRHQTPEQRAEIDRAWRNAIDRAAADFQAITARALVAYEQGVTQASATYEQALTTAQNVWTSITEPAQAAYDKQIAMAQDAVERILGPARANYTASTERARQGWEDVYPRALQTWQSERDAADRMRNVSVTAEHTP